jgi:hypothetical protein
MTCVCLSWGGFVVLALLASVVAVAVSMTGFA